MRTSAPEALGAAVRAEMQDLFASGAMVDAGGLDPSPRGTQIELRSGDVVGTNGVVLRRAPALEAAARGCGFTRARS